MICEKSDIDEVLESAEVTEGEKTIINISPWASLGSFQKIQQALMKDNWNGFHRMPS